MATPFLFCLMKLLGVLVFFFISYTSFQYDLRPLQPTAARTAAELDRTFLSRMLANLLFSPGLSCKFASMRHLISFRRSGRGLGFAEGRSAYIARPTKAWSKTKTAATWQLRDALFRNYPCGMIMICQNWFTFFFDLLIDNLVIRFFFCELLT